MAHFEQWAGFKGKEWVNSVDVRSFIQENYTPYEGDESFQLLSLFQYRYQGM